jgi:hypothetical protein
MYANHPYSSWHNAGNVQPQWGNGSEQPPSVFGALPSPTFPSKSNLVTFRFTSFNPTILNCDVVGPNSFPYFRVVTDSSMRGYTVLQREGKNIALVEWQDHPQVEIRDKMSKKAVSRLLSLSPDRRFASMSFPFNLSLICRHLSFRTMHINGQQYTWAPKQNVICVSHS